MSKWLLALLLAQAPAAPTNLRILTGVVPTGNGCPAGATCRFIATTGNDSNAGTEAAPWKTPAKAMSALTAGQFGIVRGGLYAVSTLVPTNSGVSGSPITLKAYPGETPIIDRGLTTTTGHAPTFIFDGKNWWTLDGLEIKRGGAANVDIGLNTATTGITVQNCNIYNHVTDDNSAEIWIGTGSSQIVVDNNLIHDRVIDADRPNAGSGIILFNANNVTFTHNEIHHEGNGIYFKHSLNATYPSAVQIVRYNYIHDMTAGFPLGAGMMWSSSNAQIEGNLFVGNRNAIQLFEGGAGCASLVTKDNVIRHNTFVNNDLTINLIRSDGCPGPVRTIIKDSLIRTFTTQGSDHGGLVITPFASPDSSQTTVQNNSVSSNGQTNEAHVAGTNYDIKSLPASILGKTGNIDTAPTFMGATDYRLTPASAGHNAASDGTDVGAWGAGNACVGRTSGANLLPGC